MNFREQQKDLLDRLDEFKHQNDEIRDRQKNIHIYGYDLKELLDIIRFARERGYKETNER